MPSGDGTPVPPARARPCIRRIDNPYLSYSHSRTPVLVIGQGAVITLTPNGPRPMPGEPWP
jgi:hypothetical protein